MRTRSQWILAAAFCVLAAPARGQGTIAIQTTPFENFIGLDVTIVDSGTGGGCTNFVLQRRRLLDCFGATTTIAMIPRQPGTVTHRFFDAPLTANTAYHYQILDCSGFTWAHDCGWGLPITALTMTTGSGVTQIGHGFLRSSGTPWWLDSCGGLISCGGLNIVFLPPEDNLYVDADTAVVLYGTFVRNCQFAWFAEVTQAVPDPCTVSVTNTAWGSVKRLFH